jgi:hypothetical protein
MGRGSSVAFEYPHGTRIRLIDGQLLGIIQSFDLANAAAIGFFPAGDNTTGTGRFPSFANVDDPIGLHDR